MADPAILPPALATAIERCLRKTARNGYQQSAVPAYFATPSAREAFKNVFEIVGGVPRFAYWADANYDRFIHLFGRLVQAQQPGANADEPMHVHLTWGNGQRFQGGGVCEAEVQPAVEQPVDPQLALELDPP